MRKIETLEEREKRQRKELLQENACQVAKQPFFLSLLEKLQGEVKVSTLNLHASFGLEPDETYSVISWVTGEVLGLKEGQPDLITGVRVVIKSPCGKKYFDKTEYVDSAVRWMECSREIWEMPKNPSFWSPIPGTIWGGD